MKRAIILGLLLFGMNAQADTTDPILNTEKQLEYLKKAKYFEIRAQLEAGEITLKEAQDKWKKALEKIQKQQEKEEGK